MIVLLEKSGAMFGFRKMMERHLYSAKSTLLLTSLLGAVVFIDDYLNALAVSISMKGISDHYKIPREHLAYTVNCMGACICVLIPVSTVKHLPWGHWLIMDLVLPIIMPLFRTCFIHFVQL